MRRKPIEELFEITPEKIVQARETAGMNQEELGKYIGSSRYSVSNWENGKLGNIRPQVRKRLIDFIKAGFENKFRIFSENKYIISAPYIQKHLSRDYTITLNVENSELEFLINGYPKGLHTAFEVDTVVMDDCSRKSLSEYDIALGREIKKEDFFDCCNEDCLWIIVLTGEIIFAQLSDVDKKMRQITCRTINPTARLEDTILNLDDTKKIFKVVQRVTTF